MMFKILLLALLLLATTVSSSEQYSWRPQGRFGKRAGSDSKFTHDSAVQLMPITGRVYEHIVFKNIITELIRWHSG